MMARGFACFLSALPLALLSQGGDQYHFLSTSVALRANALTLVPAHVESGRIVVPLRPAREDPLPKYLLGNDGALHELLGAVSSKNAKLPWGCTEEDALDGASLRLRRPVAVEGRFVVIGPDAQTKLEWFPARESAGAPDPACVSYRPGYRRKSVRFFETAGLHKKVFFAEWEYEGPEQRPEQRCELAFAETVGLIEARNGTCWTLNAMPRDCDWMAVSDGDVSTRELVGVLKIAERETWLVFSSEGHESQGYTALPYTPGKAVDRSRIHEAHYWGC